ncbi:MAG: hypothetical protein NTV23_16940 [Propionibacteriales bacterium]|nr:hypothetical protein [Propionibacteriales bacterium]
MLSDRDENFSWLGETSLEPAGRRTCGKGPSSGSGNLPPLCRRHHQAGYARVDCPDLDQELAFGS